MENIENVEANLSDSDISEIMNDNNNQHNNSMK